MTENLQFCLPLVYSLSPQPFSLDPRVFPPAQLLSASPGEEALQPHSFIPAQPGPPFPVLPLLLPQTGSFVWCGEIKGALLYHHGAAAAMRRASLLFPWHPPTGWVFALLLPCWLVSLRGNHMPCSPCSPWNTDAQIAPGWKHESVVARLPIIEPVP